MSILLTVGMLLSSQPMASPPFREHDEDAMEYAPATVRALVRADIFMFISNAPSVHELKEAWDSVLYEQEIRLPLVPSLICAIAE